MLADPWLATRSKPGFQQHVQRLVELNPGLLQVSQFELFLAGLEKAL
jgi:hypothetical protein